jgi:hypothetical protein
LAFQRAEARGKEFSANEAMERERAETIERAQPRERQPGGRGAAHRERPAFRRESNAALAKHAGKSAEAASVEGNLAVVVDPFEDESSS